MKRLIKRCFACGLLGLTVRSWCAPEVPPRAERSVRAAAFDVGSRIDLGPENAGSEKPSAPIAQYMVGDEVLTYYEEDCMWYPGRVISEKDGRYTVKWHEPEDGIDQVVVAPQQMRRALIPTSELQVGQKFTGVVFDVQETYAFVDIGAEEHGLLHVSRMARDRIKSAAELLFLDQSVDVWVAGKKDGHFSLSMFQGLVERDLRPFQSVPAEQWLTGVVKRIAPFGAFVTVSLDGASADGLVYLSELSHRHVRAVQDVVSEGESVSVRVLSVDVGSGKMVLSMKGAKKARKNRGLTAFAQVKSDRWLTGRVVHTAKFGAFVEVTAEGATAEGLLHNSESGAAQSSVGSRLNFGNSWFPLVTSGAVFIPKPREQFRSPLAGGWVFLCILFEAFAECCE